MKLHRKYKFATLGVAIFCTVVSSSAMTLGRANGAVFLGQSLKLSVPVRMESGEGASALCFEADVFYGDSKQEANRVGVTSEFSALTQSANVTIVSMVVVDEPVVTVYLRAGCANKTTRRFVLLAELAPSPIQQPVIATETKVPPAPRAIEKHSVPAVRSEESAARPRKKVQVAATQEEQRPLAPSTPSNKAVVRRPHLKLDPLDLAQERDLTLKLSDQLVLGEYEDLQARALAVARWRSLNATPEEIMVADNHGKAMESDIKGLHEVTAKNRAILDELTRRLEKAEAARYANPLVYSLLALLLLGGAGLLYAWLRVQRSGLVTAPWWRDEGVAETSGAVDSDRKHGGAARDRSPPVSQKPVSSQTVAPTSAALVSEVDIDLHLDDNAEPKQMPPSTGAKPATNPAGPAQVSSQPMGQADFANSMTTTLRSVNTQEMLDVRQQAEFFMTLGQHEEAIAMLRESIDRSIDTNPLVYLDLLKVLHTLGRKAEYDHYRTGFNAIFSGHVPVYGDFNRAGSGLEAYPEVCRRIVALWPSDDAVSYIEQCLVSPHGESFVQEFDLEAFRDLLMLHAVAKRIASSFDSGFLPFSAAKAASGEPHMGTAAVAGAGVDLDLSEPPGNLIDFETGDVLPPSTIKRS